MSPRVVVCQSCGSDELVHVLDIERVPVENSRLSRSAEAAADVPVGDLWIEQCRRCGFVQNSAFDAGLVAYDGDYEDSQGHSPYFVAYAERIIDELTERFDLGGSKILEIGCGRGDFLDMFCDRADAVGIGLDPAAGRGAGKRGRIEVRSESFGSGSGTSDADLVMCRHTLEHIPDVATFLSTLRAEIGDDDPVVYIEVPDTARIADEGAFWDIYFEHCAYFGVDSLSDLLRRTGFDPVDVRLEYGDQYVVAFARPASHRGHDDVTTPTRFDDFAAVTANVDAWRAWARDRADAGERVALWAASSKAVGLLSLVPEVSPVVAVDVNPAKAGRFLPASGVPICRPDELAAHEVDAVLVMNPIYADEIAASLAEFEISASLWAMGAQPVRISR